MMKVSLLVVVLALVCVSASAQGFYYCDHASSSSGPLTVSTVTLNPSPPQQGVDDVVTLTGTINQVVANSSVTLNIYYNTFFGIQVFPLSGQNNVFNVCDHSVCPQGPGAITAEIIVPGQSLPLPGGDYTATATITDTNSGATLSCVSVDFSV